MDNNRWPVRADFPIAQPGLKFIILTILITGMLFYFGWMVFACLFTGLTLFITWFFRDPDRTPPVEADAMTAPADGKVIAIDRLPDCDYLDGTCIKISIFMNVFNVHVNRIPFDGEIEQVVYHPGKFVNASFDKASTHNERNVLVIKTASNYRFAVVQIAGLIARRIVNCAKAGDVLKKGDRYGMIQFGSRLDLYLPEEFSVSVKKGEKTTAGSTVIGYLK